MNHLGHSINLLWNAINGLWNSKNDLWNFINNLWNSINAYFTALCLAIIKRLYDKHIDCLGIESWVLQRNSHWLFLRKSISLSSLRYLVNAECRSYSYVVFLSRTVMFSYSCFCIKTYFARWKLYLLWLSYGVTNTDCIEYTAIYQIRDIIS